MGGKAKVVNGGRIRKVTITEIEDGQDWSWPDPGNIEDIIDESEDIDEVIIEKTTEEVFAALEDVVTDWKIKLEVVVGDGLKKIKKASKEKKAMMKHLPGDGVQKGSGVLVKAKEEILNDWKKEVARTVKDTHNKLNDLGTTKVKDVVTVSEGILKKAGGKTDKKSGTDKNGKAVVKDAYLDLKKLMRELDTLYQNYNFSKMNFDKVPIYTATNKNNKEIARPMNKPFPWWKPMCTLADMGDLPRKSAAEFLQKETAVAEILQDFIQDQAPYNSLLEEWFKTQSSQKRILPKISSKKEVKTPRRGSNSIMRMKERKEQRQMKQYQLKEIENKGEKRYLVIKKKTKNTMDEVEDIFADWNKNFSIIKRPRSTKPRQRKLSHRQERRELLKSVKEEAAIGPMTYAEMLRRGLKKPSEQEMMEDIFQNWTNFLDELTEIRDPQKKSSRTNVDELDFFKVWKHNLHVPAARMEDIDIMSTTHSSLLPGLDCGQPTVKMAVQVKKQEISPQRSAANKMPSVTSTKKKAKSPPGFSSKQSVKVLPGQGKQIIPKAEEKPMSIPIPPPPPPPPTPVKKPYEPVAPNKQLLPFVEKALIAIPPPPPMPPKPASIPLHDLSKKPLEMKPKCDFKPSAHSQRMLTPPKPVASVTRKVESKPQLTAEQIYECAKNSSNKSSWQNMLIPSKATSPSGRGDSKRKLPSAPEEVFQSWRYIFTEENMKQRRTPFVLEEGYESIFKEWAEVNLKEPEPRKRMGSNSTEESPKASRKAMKKQIKCENIEDDMTEFKDNRRHDFAKNASIKDKKRTDAVRRSTGRKIK